MILLIAMLLFVNALFVMAEMAFVSSKKSRLKAMADKGDRAAILALALIDNPTKYLSTVQIGITLTGIVLGMFGEQAIAEDLSAWLTKFPLLKGYERIVAVGITVTLLTLLTLVLAELVPKRLGQLRPETVARFMARPMDLMSRLTAPLVRFLALSTDVIVRLVPVRPRAESEGAEEEVKALIESGTRSGVFHETEQAIVERVFRLGDQRVTSIMVPRADIDALDVSDTVERVRVAIAAAAHSHYPVCKGDLDHIVGVVHVKDLVRHGVISTEINLEQLAKPPMFVPESTPALAVLKRFRDKNAHIAFVIDEYGLVVGLVTLNDITEAILGDVAPPFSSADQLVVERGDGSWLLDGMLSIEELRELMGVEKLDREEEAGFRTLGGFVMTFLGRIPSAGDRFKVGEAEFEVVDMDRTRVDKVILTKAAKASEAAADGAPGEAAPESGKN